MSISYPTTMFLKVVVLIPGTIINWTHTLEDLPVCGTDEKGIDFVQMEYRAVEVHTATNTNTVEGAQNYEDQMDYTNEANDGHTYASGTDVSNISQISNRLNTLAKSISAEKVWYASDDATSTDIKAVFELQYKKAAGTDTWHSFDPAVKKECTKTKNGEASAVTWTNLPKCDREGHELQYQVIEHAVTGYTGNATPTSVTATPANAATPTNVCYSFTNIELQSYTVTKTWAMPADVSYLPKDSNDDFSSTFKLQKKVNDEDWTDCKDAEPRTLKVSANTSGVWTNLPKYTEKGEKNTYRAVETHINGTAVATNTDGNYIVTYDYDKDGTNPDNKANPAFDDTRTDATNRLVYGFVDLSKMAAYLASGNEVTKTDLLNPKLSGVEFTIQKDGTN